MGLDTLLLDFYGLALIHLTDSLRQVVQTVYVWYVIYIYIYELFIYIPIYIREKCRVAILLCSVFLFGTEKRMYCTNELFRAHSCFGCWKGRANWTRDFSPSRIECILEHQKNTRMTFYGINQDQLFLIPNFYCML